MSVCYAGQMNARPRRVTVSGFSSGGYLAQALFVAHSAKIRGAAVFSHSKGNYNNCLR